MKMPPYVLIADDDPDILEGITAILETQSYRLATAHDGLQCMEQIRQEVPDLLILDMMMPRMDGLELMGRMRADHADTKVIVISGYDDVIDFAERERDVVMTLRKPFELNDVADALRVAFGDN